MKDTYLRKYYKEMTKNRMEGSLELADLYRSYFRNINFNYPLVSDAYWFHVYWACYAFNELARAFNTRMEIIIYEDRGHRVYETVDGDPIGTLAFHVVHDSKDKHPEFKHYLDKILECFSDDGDMEKIYKGEVFPEKFIVSPPPGRNSDLGFYERYKAITGYTDEQLRKGTTIIFDEEHLRERDAYYDSLEDSDFNFDDSDIDDMFADMKSKGSDYNIYDTQKNFEPAPWERRGPNSEDVISARQKMADIIKSKMNKDKN